LRGSGVQRQRAQDCTGETRELDPRVRHPVNHLSRGRKKRRASMELP
jgi:hypothetical protein